MQRVEERKRILIVEDEDMMLDVYNMILGDTFNLTVKRDGKEGLNEALKNNIDIIILDIIMPGMNGLEFLSQYNRTIPKKKKAYVIVVTGSGNIKESDVKPYGADAFVYKPDIKIDEFKELVSSYAH